MFSFEYIWKPVSMTQVFVYVFNLDLFNLNHFKQKKNVCMYVFGERLTTSSKIHCIELICMLLNSDTDTFIISQD